MSNNQYWQNRMLSMLNMSDQRLEKSTVKLYKKAYANLEKELLILWNDMLIEGQPSTATLYKYGRFKKIQENIQKELYNLGVQLDSNMQMNLLDLYKTGYIAQATQLGAIKASFTLLNEQTAKEVVKANFKGATYSNRVWDNMNKLKGQLEEQITQTAIQGKDVRKASKALKNRMNVSYSDAKRLIVTENSRILNEACRNSAIDRGYTSYHVLVEPNACTDCMNDFRDRQFDINEVVLPQHPHCKCTMIVDLDTI